MADAAIPLPGVPPAPRPSVPTGYALVLLGATFFILNAGVSRLVLDAGVPPDRLASIRAGGTAALLLVGCLLSGRGPALRLRRAEIVPLVGYGVFGIGMLQWAYFVAIDRLPIGVALLLEYLAPLLIALWARLVQRRPVRATVWPALGLSLVGLALVARVWDGGALDGLGTAAGLLAAGCFAAYFLIGEHLVARRDVLTTTTWGFLVAAVFWLAVRPPWALPAATVTTDAALRTGGSAPTLPVWVLLGWIVVLGTLLPFAVETAALRHLPATVVGAVAMIEPVGAAALAWLWFGEVLDAVQVSGGLLVVVGILLAQTARRS